MIPSPRRLLSLVRFVALGYATGVPAVSGSSATGGLDLAVARRNAFEIFNAVHSAMRQWGSSVNHNGLSFFLATVPENNLFYHGTHTRGRPDRFEWLAFEVEHAGGFARSWELAPPDRDDGDGGDGGGDLPGPPRQGDSAGLWAWHLYNIELQEGWMAREHPTLPRREQWGDHEQRPLAGNAQDGDGDDENPRPRPKPPPGRPPRHSRGYFQTYRAARPLNLIYIDGMAAAKCGLGTLDSQDLILLAGTDQGDRPGLGEQPRAEGLCKLAAEWGIDGWIRMESGFEIIYCDFGLGGGLDLVFEHGSSWTNETARNVSVNDALGFEWLRAAAQRYHGMSSGRVSVDWSSMVSAFAYDVNISNPDPARQDLPRVINATDSEREAIRARLAKVVAARKGAATTVDWQGVVDLVVSRYSSRLDQLVRGNLSADSMWVEVSTLVGHFQDYPADGGASNPSPASLLLCTRHYLDAPLAGKDTWTPEDTAIYTAVEAVSEDICSSLFQIQSILGSGPDGDDAEEAALARSREIATDLASRLRWPTWRECGRCASPGEFCFIPMFPAGNVEDYYSPRCKGPKDLLRSFGYWSGGRPF